jgi:hypothetical protein
MKVSVKNRHQLANNLKRLPAEQIKKAVIKYLNTENTEFINWEYRLSSEVDSFQEWVKDQRGNN